MQHSDRIYSKVLNAPGPALTMQTRESVPLDSSRNRVLNLRGKTTEKKGGLACTSHFCFKCATTHCYVCKVAISRFYVTAKYTGASRNKHI